ncbi:protein NDR1-like [Macadamia integrifolia]|uniref:protein NDR1-like n=1 Tax=Macadamia integrifolia TaxID=60698 RepID=UPI001C53323D|nr:protein NDR1-like [Macadamia integrifolia]
MSESKNRCRCCVSFIFTIGLTALFWWLNLRSSSPTFSIQNFSVPALNTSAKTKTTTTTTTTVAIDFRIQNSNKYEGVYYDALNITLYYSPNLSFPVGNASIFGFYQRHKKKAVKEVTLHEVKIPWGAAARTVSSNGTVGFRVDLATAVRYKVFGWKTGRRQMKVHGDVSVDNLGKQTYKKQIKLRSAAPNRDSHRPRFWGVMALLFVLLSSDHHLMYDSRV